jgi:hypothetical protein
MKTYARWLFGVAASFNAAVGLFVLFGPNLFAQLAHLDPIAGTNRLLAALTGGFIALFGYAYARIALDPVRFRPFIGFGAIGKLSAVAIMSALWLTGIIGPVVPALGSGDLVFAALFLDYLRRK